MSFFIYIKYWGLSKLKVLNHLLATEDITEGRGDDNGYKGNMNMASEPGCPGWSVFRVLVSGMVSDFEATRLKISLTNGIKATVLE